MNIITFIGLLILSAFAVPSEAYFSREELQREQEDMLEELRWTENASGSSNGIVRNITEWSGIWWQYGGWTSTSYVSSSENDRSPLTQDALDHVWEQDFRYYLSTQNIDGRSKFYARLASTVTVNSAASNSISNSNWIQPRVELFYYTQQLGKRNNRKSTISIGRQYVKVEKGITFAAIADGIKYETFTKKFKQRYFMVRHYNGEDRIDFLAPGPGRSKRISAGGELTWKIKKIINTNIFTVYTKDLNDKNPDGNGQRHLLDSFYYGMQFDGTVFYRLRLVGQVMRQIGKTYPHFDPAVGFTGKINRDAYAWTAGFRYYFDSEMKPKLHFDYVFASGDDDAVGNSVSTRGGSGSLTGSDPGGHDKRFIPFGGINLGYALTPGLTNISVYKTGFSFKPFRGISNGLWKKFSVHPTFYVFKRPKSSGSISDPFIVRGPGSSSDVGKEFDLSLKWRVASDLKYKFKLGIFKPGDAYLQPRDNEIFMRFKASLDL